MEGTPTGVAEAAVTRCGAVVVAGAAGAFTVEPGTALVLGIRVASGPFPVKVPEPLIVL